MTLRHGLRHAHLPAALCVGLLMLLSACGGGSDDATATPPPATSAAAASPTSAATATSAPSVAAEAESPTSEATATTAAPTATTAATTAATATEAASPTSAPDASPTADVDAILGDVESIDPADFPNFTLKFNLDAENTPGVDDSESTDAPTSISFEIEQSDPDTYHMKIDSDGTAFETWKVAGTNYISQDGQITEVPADSGGDLFSPSLFLQAQPELPAEAGARKVGEENVSGRATTHYVISADHLADYLAFDSGEEPPNISDAAGEFNVWIDNELRILVKGDSNFTWTNEDGSAGKFIYTYLIDQIGSTPPVSAPQ